MAIPDNRGFLLGVPCLEYQSKSAAVDTRKELVRRTLPWVFFFNNREWADESTLDILADLAQRL